jgi:Tfp pilus assembly protein PilF
MKADDRESKLYYYLGTSYFELADYSNVIYTLEAGLKYDSRSPEMDNLLAYVYSLQDVKLDDAVRLIKQALMLQPENIAYLDTFGWILFQKEDFSRSYEIFNHVIDLLGRGNRFEGLDEIYYHIGMIFEKMGKKEEAMGFYSTGLKINPSNDLIKNRMK